MSRRAGRTKIEGKVVSSRTVYRGPLFHVTTDRVLDPGGIAARRDIVRHRGSVVIMAVEESAKEPRLLLVRQYRHAAKQFLWELPAGGIDAGEDTLLGAKRELLEETGYSAARWQRALFFWPSPGFLDETMTIFLARGLKPGKASPEEDEFIRKRLFPLSSVVRLVLKGAIRDSKTIAGTLWLDRMLRDGALDKTSRRK